jgi:two-component system sensor histidine kinase/response regulator
MRRRGLPRRPPRGGAAAGAGGASGVLDEARQTQLQQLMGARYPLLLSRAADAIEEQVALIARELPAGDPAAIRDALHRLKNNAGEVGARALHGLVSGLEFTARSELPSASSLAGLRERAREAVHALRALAKVAWGRSRGLPDPGDRPAPGRTRRRS